MTPRPHHASHLLERTVAILALSSAAWGLAAAAPAVEPSAKDKTALEAAFARADANGDSRISQEEAARMPAIAARFAQLDENQDGSLSLAEFALGYNAAP